MMNTMTRHKMIRASMLGHRFFHRGVLEALLEVPLSDRNNDVAAGVGSSRSCSPWSLRSSRDSNGVCSVVLLECWERAEREDRADLREAGRSLGVRVAEPHVVASEESMALPDEKYEKAGGRF